MGSTTQINAGMTISLNKKLYKIESAVKVTVPKGTPFIKTKLRDIVTNELIEKSFKLNQTVEEVSLNERKLEFLYPEGDDYLFLDSASLDTLLVPAKVIGEKVSFLKEGVEITGSFYGDIIFNIELPQFLELMVVKTDHDKDKGAVTNTTRLASLETGAVLEVPAFIEVGDIVKVDTGTKEYIQRV